MLRSTRRQQQLRNCIVISDGNCNSRQQGLRSRQAAGLGEAENALAVMVRLIACRRRCLPVGRADGKVEIIRELRLGAQRRLGKEAAKQWQQ